jgi:hypothetical protein
MKVLQAKLMKEVSYERPDTWVTVCTGHIGDTSSPRCLASLDFQASYALFSSVISSAFVSSDEAVFSGVSSALALFARTFPPHAAKMKAAAAVKPKRAILAIIAASK